MNLIPGKLYKQVMDARFYSYENKQHAWFPPGQTILCLEVHYEEPRKYLYHQTLQEVFSNMIYYNVLFDNKIYKLREPDATHWEPFFHEPDYRFVELTI